MLQSLINDILDAKLINKTKRFEFREELIGIENKIIFQHFALNFQVELYEYNYS